MGIIYKLVAPPALCWTADSHLFEILINGLKRGVSPKHRYREKARYTLKYLPLSVIYSLGSLNCSSRPRVSRIALLHSFNLILVAQKKPLKLVRYESNNPTPTNVLLLGSNTETYLQLKLLASNYKIAKEKLIGDGGPFVGWLVSGSQWQGFNRNGESPDGKLLNHLTLEVDIKNNQANK